MALIKCGECGSQISDTASACPQCGAKPRKKDAGLGTALVVILVLGFVAIVFSPHGSDALRQPEAFNPEQTARGMCMLQIKDSLHDPGSAEFEDSSSTVISHEGDTWTVFRPVRAKNGFGAMRRATFECKYRLVGESFTLLSLQEIKP